MSKPVKIRAGTTALLGIIGDEETVTGFLLAGIGDNDPKHAENFLIVSQSMCDFFVMMIYICCVMIFG